MGASFINTVNTLFGLGTIFFQAACLVMIVGLTSKDKGPLFAWAAKNSILLVFLVGIAGLAGSLIYQYVIGFTPCVLCWYQRIVLYPIAIISVVALIKKHSTEIFHYVMTLSVIGFVVALYHNVEKMIGKDLLACDVAGPSCLQIFVKAFGYIDIPIMSLSIFALVILLILNRKRFNLPS